MLTVQILASSQMEQPLQWKEGRIFKVLFQITPTNVDSPGNANPYVAGGDTLDLTQLFSLTGAAPGQLAPTFELLANLPIASNPSAPGAATLFLYRYCKGTSLKNGTMQVFESGVESGSQQALAELAAGNYPAAVLADTIVGEAYFVMP